MKYFNVTHKTTRDDLRRQRNELAIKFHPDKGLSGGDDAIKEINSEYENAEKVILHFEKLRGTDEHGKAFVSGLLDYFIERGLEYFFPKGAPEYILLIIDGYKKKFVEKVNASEFIAAVEQKIKQYKKT